MESTLEVAKQDIMAAKEALKTQDLRLVRIMGNRLMSNMLIGERKDLMILGYLVREVAGEFAGVKLRDADNMPKCESTGQEFLDELAKMIDAEKVDPEGIWMAYRKYENEIRKFLPTKVELSVYKDNADFTRKTTRVLTQYLKDNMELLLDERNQLLGGILSELTRIMNVHGAEIEALIFYTLTRALAEYYKYAIFSEMRGGFVENTESLKTKVFPYVEKIVDLCSSSDSSKQYQSANDILAHLGSGWRDYFIKYGELAIPGEFVVEGRKPRVDIPENAKKKIGDTIAEAFEKEIKK